jgi:hypothetical protein
MTKFILMASMLIFSSCASAEVRVSQNQLVVDGKKQPQLFGAEIQYFRLRGGYAPNQSREKVIALWNRALDQAVAAGMNAVSFYIPWDFHEYAEGKFDFTGTADDDGDGRPDYPSRDVLTFLRLIKEHGIHHVMVRPGPYINAEWGFLGFGAIPKWFHNKYPDSHMLAPSGQRTKLYDYHNPDFLKKSRKWLETVYAQVIKANLNPSGPIDFIQVDNETNYLWQSIYNHDYGPRSIASYRAFLQGKYGNLAKLNSAHHRGWKNWADIQAPTVFGKNLAEDQDWYRYHDESIHAYLQKIRQIWEEMGVKEPQVLFTLAESYNAAEHGLLPNYLLRNDRGRTGLMTVNLYPKTFELASHPLMNNPFKADLDVKAATEANSAYWGSRQEWAMGPEIQGGWWRGINVTDKSRRQTYLTVLGHGLKAFFLYYFNEGDNFGVHWAYDKAHQLYGALRAEMKIPKDRAMKDLPQSFWDKLQKKMDNATTLGFYAKGLMETNIAQDEKLYFDAPLNGEAQPGAHFADLEKIGTQVIAPYRDFLGRSLAVQDDIALVKDVASHVPNGSGFDSVMANADWAGGLLGLSLTAGVNPKIVIGELSPFGQEAYLHIDTGVNAPRTVRELHAGFQAGHGIVNFLGDSLARDLHYPGGKLVKPGSSRVVLTAYLDKQGKLSPKPVDGGRKLSLSAAAAPLFAYNRDVVEARGCEPILFSGGTVVGYRCRKEAPFFQIGALLFDDFNSSGYGEMKDFSSRRAFFEALLADAQVKPLFRLSEKTDRLAVFARRDPSMLWVTVKSGSPSSQEATLRLNPSLLPGADLSAQYRVKDLLNGHSDQLMTGADLVNKGFSVQLEGNGSTVYVVEPAT